MSNNVESLLQLFFRCSVHLVVTMIYDPFICKFSRCNGKYSASVTYPLPFRRITRNIDMMIDKALWVSHGSWMFGFAMVVAVNREREPRE
jgi:hypothetical protein